MPRCFYGQCRAQNLCKDDHCVGEQLNKSGFEMRDGQIVRKGPPLHLQEKREDAK